MNILRIVKKVITVVAGLSGAVAGGTAAIGASVTGELILDAVLIIGALILIGINGKDGLPDWLVRIIEGKVGNGSSQQEPEKK